MEFNKYQISNQVLISHWNYFHSQKRVWHNQALDISALYMQFVWYIDASALSEVCTSCELSPWKLFCSWKISGPHNLRYVQKYPAYVSNAEELHGRIRDGTYSQKYFYYQIFILKFISENHLNLNLTISLNIGLW